MKMEYTDAIVDLDRLTAIRQELNGVGKVVVFTNGCFDLLHRGHVAYLADAKALGDVLMVGLNDDPSVRRLKGPKRPLMPLEDRAAILAALVMVDYVCPFSGDTPEAMLTRLRPDILVKGGDYALDQVVGREIVEEAGGKVMILPLHDGRSTTGIIERILDRYSLACGSDPR
jgi:D-beta-D-heptose 7-phosphate kinase/D-beta-D-heptose 1-phosphate adenosyltransferase